MSLACIVLVAMSCFHIWMSVGGNLLPGCPDMCKCDGEQIRCERFIPSNVPYNVSEVLLSLNSKSLSPGIFCNVSWNNIIKLSINYTDVSDIRLDDYVFLCLKKIQVLKLYTICRLETTNNSLYGLENVTVLDLSGCARMYTRDLVILLSVKTNVANLKKLILSGFGSFYFGLDLSQDLIDIFADKDIAELDLTNTGLSSGVSDFSGICDTLKILNMSNSDLDFRSKMPLSILCNSLSIIDLTGALFPYAKLAETLKCENEHLKINTIYTLLKHVDIIYAGRLLAADKTISVSNCSVTELGESYNLKEFHFNGYNIPTLDFELVNFFDQLQYLDLSGNMMQTLGFNSLKTFKHLIKLDLSKNKLSQNRLYGETFSVLFQKNSNLTEINLSQNGLRYLPRSTFSSNTLLKRINISNNRIQQVTFDISLLINLEILDMQNNSVQHLNEFSRETLDSLYEIQRLLNYTKPNTTSTLLVDLRANPFSCECDSLPFIIWFIMSPIFNTTRHQYQCRIEDREIEMNDKAVAAAKDDCERPKRKMRKILLFSVIPTIVTATLALVFVYVVKRYRRKKLYQKLEDQVGLLHNDKFGFRFPVFVSYSSDDIAFVIPNVINPLRVRYYIIITQPVTVCHQYNFYLFLEKF